MVGSATCRCKPFDVYATLKAIKIGSTQACLLSGTSNQISTANGRSGCLILSDHACPLVAHHLTYFCSSNCYGIHTRKTRYCPTKPTTRSGRRASSQQGTDAHSTQPSEFPSMRQVTHVWSLAVLWSCSCSDADAVPWLLLGLDDILALRQAATAASQPPVSQAGH
jgi:hypothetical protein